MIHGYHLPKNGGIPSLFHRISTYNLLVCLSLTLFILYSERLEEEAMRKIAADLDCPRCARLSFSRLVVAVAVDGAGGGVVLMLKLMSDYFLPYSILLL